MRKVAKSEIWASVLAQFFSTLYTPEVPKKKIFTHTVLYSTIAGRVLHTVPTQHNMLSVGKPYTLPTIQYTMQKPCKFSAP